MNFTKLKRDFLATLPVIGPHANIEADLMLAGLKPLTWFPAYPDEELKAGTLILNEGLKTWHYARKKLDKAVENGTLLSMDIETTVPNIPEYIDITRHYCQLDQEANMRRVAHFNLKAFERQEILDEDLDKDIGHYLGYRRRDIAFFNAMQSGFVPKRLIPFIIKFNAPSQVALRQQLLERAGIPDERTHFRAIYDTIERKWPDLDF